MKRRSRSFWSAGGIFLCCLLTANPVQAQVASDGTLSTNVTTKDNQNFTINNGNRVGNNLFHSFSEFSVPAEGSVFFNNAPDIQNIISRVIGSSVSNINGTIRANGTANLFLLNPNGIIFGPKASLDIGGSFLASTASSLNFADGNQFSATTPQTAPLLTISVPLGLQFGENPGRILVQGNGQGLRVNSDLIDTSVGLRVPPNQTLALVGGDMALSGGTLKTAGGRIELGSVAGSSLVNLTPTSKGWVLGYEGLQNFRDIQLSQQAAVDASGAGGGDIQVRGKQVTLTDGSQIEASTLGSEPGGTLAVTASESVELIGYSADGYPSGLSASVYEGATGSGGSLTLETGDLSIRDGAQIAASTFGAGNAGALTVRAFDSVALSGEGNDPSGLFAQADQKATGAGGNLTLETRQLSVQDGAQIAASTFGAGNAGALTVRAFDSVALSGEGKNPSALFAQADQGATGAGGNLTLETRQLSVQDGAQIAASTFGAGNAGALTVRAFDSVALSGEGKNPSGLFAQQAEPGATGNGGNLTLETARLSVQDEAQIAVTNLGTGRAGNLVIDPNLVKLDRGTITAQTESGEGGNITIRGRNIQLGNNSLISTTAGGSGHGGNIAIDTKLLFTLGNSDIRANAFQGQGGNIHITTQGLFRSPDGDITASSERGINGVVEINRPDIDPSADLVILPADPVDVSGLIAQGCSVGGSSVARGQSEFVVTGRGGLPPTPEEATRSDSALADLGTPVQSKENYATAAIPSNLTSASPAELVEAQGWVIGSKGEVILTKNAPTVTINVPWLKPTTCNAS